MISKTTSCCALKVSGEDKKSSTETIVCEYPLHLFVDGKDVTTLLCSPEKLKELVFGFLKTKGMIGSTKDVSSFEIDEMQSTARVKTSKSKQAESLQGGFGQIEMKRQDIYRLMDENLSYSQVFQKTGGTHCVSLCDSEKLLISCEDVARHNAMDKVIGQALLEGIDLGDKAILLSGRVSYEMMQKAVKLGIPVVISKSAPTNLSIGLANKVGITLAGFVRGEKMNIYANGFRIK